MADPQVTRRALNELVSTRPVRHPNLVLASTIVALTAALVLSLIHGQIVIAVIAAVIWTSYVVMDSPRS